MFWVDAGDHDLVAGSLCLLHSPDGDRAARVVIEPKRLMTDVGPTPGYLVLSTLTDDEARAVHPSTTLPRSLNQATHPSGQFAADGSRATLLAIPGTDTRSLAADLARALQLPVVVRDEDGHLPELELPQLLQRVTYYEVRATVEAISAFREEITLKTDSGETLTVAFQDRKKVVRRS